MIGGAVAGAFLMINGTTSYTSGGLGSLAFSTISLQKAMLVAWFSVFGILIAAAIGFGLTMAFWKDDAVEEEIEGQPAMTVRKSDHFSSRRNDRATSSAKDEAFAQGVLGKAS